jgi:putative acetyltransferase
MSRVAQTLIRALNAELSELYPEEEARHFRLDAAEVAPGRGAFLVAYLGSKAVGCGAVRRLGGARAEIKRIYTLPEVRGMQVGGTILAALEAVAKELGVSRLVLETGVRQPAAQALYRRMGFRETEAFGEYVGNSLSVCMAKDLTL